MERLQSDGRFTDEQAKLLSTVLREVLASALASATPSSKHDELAQRVASDLTHLKSEILIIERNHYEKMVSEVGKLTERVNRLSDDSMREVEKSKASARLDRDLEKARVDAKMVDLQSAIERVENRLETHRSSTRSRISEVKFDVLRAILGGLASITALGLGFARFYYK